MISHRNGADEETVSEHCTRASEISSKLGEPVHIQELARLCALLHDMGKDNHAFNEYIHIVTQEGRKWEKEKLNHSSAGGIWIYEKYADADVMQTVTAEIVAWTIFSHHGINNMISMDGKNKFQDRLHPTDNIFYEESKQNFENECTEDLEKLFNYAVEEIREAINIFQSSEVRNFHMGMLLRLNLSILLESDRRSTAIFMKSRVAEDTYDRLELWDTMLNKLKSYIEAFSSVGELNSLRKQLGEQCFERGKEKEGIYLLQIPTGGGKTLASMLFAINHAKAHKKKRIFYVAPFKSILVQNAQVYREVFQMDEVIFEHHSDVIVEEDGADLAKALAESWNVPMILTTMVQFLNTLFNDKTNCIRRMQALTNSVIILDEIQTLPIRCIHMFNTAMNFLKHYGTTIVLCSATQPLLEYVDTPIELDGNLIQKVPEVFRQFQRTDFVDMRTVKNCEQIADLTKMLMLENQSGIIIVNTKLAAGKIYQYLIDSKLEDTIIYYLSTSLCPQHRMDILEQFKKSLAKKEKVICVATPLIEAGVDMSAEWVIRSVTGWDSLIQAAGRCNRNAEHRRGKVYLVECEEENLGSLPDMKNGREATLKILDDFREKPEIFDADLSSLKVIDAFYHSYYWGRKHEMNYSLEHTTQNLFDLLSDNWLGKAEAQKKTKHIHFAQAFKDAGKNFEAIDSHTIGVLAPYQRGKALIEMINSSIDFNELSQLLKQSQRYTINIFQGERGQKTGLSFYRLVSEGMVKKFDTCDAFYLVSGYYDGHKGINIDGRMDTLIL